jgi:uncharacterized protein YcfJ
MALMKKLLVSSLVLVSVGALAQESGRVISSTPIVQQVAVQHQNCTQQPVAVQRPSSGAGALLGALAGAGVGNAIGGGMGHVAAIGLGTVLGAAVGNNIEQQGTSVQNVQTCAPQTSYENRTVGYNVTYEYGGKQYTTQMPYDPGQTVRLNISPVGTAAPVGAGQQALVTAPPIADGTAVAAAPAPQVVVQQPATTVVYPSYVYPAPYYPSYWYPPVSLSLGYVWYGGGHHHRHWR